MAADSDPRRRDEDAVDAAFADIIANWHETAGRASADAPQNDGTNAADTDTAAADSHGDAVLDHTAERPSSGADNGGTSPAPEQPHRPRTVEEVFGPLDGSAGWRSYSLAEEPEEDFVPSAPQALPRDDLGFWGALIGVGGGPLLLVLIAFCGDGGERFWLMVAIGLTVMGFALLFMRLPKRKDPEEDDYDDGAVV